MSQLFSSMLCVIFVILFTQYQEQLFCSFFDSILLSKVYMLKGIRMEKVNVNTMIQCHFSLNDPNPKSLSDSNSQWTISLCASSDHFIFLQDYCLRLRMVAQWLKYLTSMCHNSMWVSVYVLFAGFHNKFPAYGLGKQSRMAQSLAMLNPHGDQEAVSGSWLWISSASAIAAARGVKQ